MYPPKKKTFFLNIMEFYKRLCTGISYLNIAAALWVSSTLLFSFKYQYWALIVFFFSYILDYTLNKRWKNFTWNRDKWEYIAFIIFFLLIPLRHLFEPITTPRYNAVIERYLPFLGFGIIGILGINEKYKPQYFGYVFITTAIITSLYLIVDKIGLTNFITSAEKTYLFGSARITYVNAHMTFNLYLNTALIFVGFIITRKKINTYIRIATTICGLMIYYLLFISEGRTGFITANLIICIFFLYRIWFLSRKIFIPSIILSGILLLIAVSSHKRIAPNALNSDPRSIIWEVTIELIKEKPFFGYGASKGRQKFVEAGMNNQEFVDRYAGPFIINNPLCNGEKGLSMMHPHNLFLETLLEFGIVGLTVLLFLLFFPLTTGEINKRIYIWMFIGAFSIQAMFETLGNHLLPILFVLIVVLWNQGKGEDYNNKIED